MRGRTLRLSFAVLEAALAAALAVTLVGCAGAKPAPDSGSGSKSPKEPIKVGVIVSLTGTYAGLGQPEKKVLEMEAARINEAGGINGRSLELIIEDDATDEAKAVAAASKLIAQDRVVALIGATGTGQTMAVRTEVDRAGIPQVSMAGGTVITGDFDPLVFATPWSNTIVAPVTIDYLKNAGLTKVGLISDSGGFGKDGAAVFTAEAAKAGVTVTSAQTFNAGDADMTAQLTKIKGSGAQAVIIWSAGKEAATIAQNARQLGIDLPLLGSHGNARLEFVTGAGDAAEGFRFAAGKILLPETYGEGSEAYSVATEFTDRYVEAYDETPSTFAGHAYDALYLVVEAAKRVEGDMTPEKLRAELEATQDFVGIGGTFTFTSTDHNGLSKDDLVMYVVKDGAWTLAE